MDKNDYVLYNEKTMFLLEGLRGAKSLDELEVAVDRVAAMIAAVTDRETVEQGRQLAMALTAAVRWERPLDGVLRKVSDLFDARQLYEARLHYLLLSDSDLYPQARELVEVVEAAEEGKTG